MLQRGIDRIIFENEHTLEERLASWHLTPALYLHQRAILVLTRLCLLPLQVAKQAVRGCRGSMEARNGRVLINRPTIAMLPSSSAGRPETVTPKTTSAAPL